MPVHRDKERAKLVIVEIIRQAGGRLHNKTNLFKAFWRAHVAFAQQQHSDLSDWPIVRMPNGPGIDRFDILLGELMAEGAVEAEQVQYQNGSSGFVFHLLPSAPSGLVESEIDAVRDGVEFVDGQTAASVSSKSHVDSRSWKSAKDGQELDIVLDSIPEDEYQAMRRRMADNRHIIEQAAGSSR